MQLGGETAIFLAAASPGVLPLASVGCSVEFCWVLSSARRNANKDQGKAVDTSPTFVSYKRENKALEMSNKFSPRSIALPWPGLVSGRRTQWPVMSYLLSHHRLRSGHLNYWATVGPLSQPDSAGKLFIYSKPTHLTWASVYCCLNGLSLVLGPSWQISTHLLSFKRPPTPFPPLDNGKNEKCDW